MNPTDFFVDIIVDNNPLLQYFSVNNFSLFNMLWNLFLMMVPFFVCLILIKYWKKNNLRKYYQKIYAGVLFVVWVLFIPNTAYIITDARHMLGDCQLNKHRVCPEIAWTIMFFFFFATIGWVALVLLINQMKVLIKDIFGKKTANLFPVLLLPIISLGVLMGLVQRWNSWELFFSPLSILSAAFDYFTNGVYFLNWFIFSVVMIILYIIGDKLFKKNLLVIDDSLSLRSRVKQWINKVLR